MTGSNMSIADVRS